MEILSTDIGGYWDHRTAFARRLHDFRDYGIGSYWNISHSNGHSFPHPRYRWVKRCWQMWMLMGWWDVNVNEVFVVSLGDSIAEWKYFCNSMKTYKWFPRSIVLCISYQRSFSLLYMSLTPQKSRSFHICFMFHWISSSIRSVLNVTRRDIAFVLT